MSIEKTGIDQDCDIMNKKITIISQEGTKFNIDNKIAEMSGLINNIIGDDFDDFDDEIPLPNVKEPILNKIIQFCNHYHEEQLPQIEKPLKSPIMSENVSEWYANFIDLDQQTIFDIILAANYMDIKPLLDLSCAKIACMIKGKTPEEIRKTFNILNDFTPEEETQIREENKWCEST